jgi:hypothetical protein
MRALVAGLGCAWVLWSAPVSDSQPGPTAIHWSLVGKVGGQQECAAYQAHKARGDATRMQYVCLPEGEQPKAR